MIKIANGHYVLPDFSLQIELAAEAGKFYAVLGPSGAGKSTLLSVIAGFETLKSGTVFLDGKDMTNVTPATRPVSMVFQDYNAFAHLSVWDNLALGLSPALKLSDLQSAQVEAALQKVGLTGYEKRLPSELSGGERQRIVLARVLVRNKPILLLDEPFAALDPALRQEMLDLVVALQQDKKLTVLLVTHQPQDATQVADGVIFVSEGKVHPPIATDRFFTSRDTAVLKYLGRPG